MAKDDKHPVTAAVRVLRDHEVAFTHHPYEYEERGGTEVSARELGVDEHAVIKTLIMEDDAKKPAPIQGGVVRRSKETGVAQVDLGRAGHGARRRVVEPGVRCGPSR